MSVKGFLPGCNAAQNRPEQFSCGGLWQLVRDDDFFRYGKMPDFIRNIIFYLVNTFLLILNLITGHHEDHNILTGFVLGADNSGFFNQGMGGKHAFDQGCAQALSFDLNAVIKPSLLTPS